jgi:serine/threonine-protein kinase
MSHPSRRQLEQLLAEELPLSERGPVEAHVNSCDDCLRQLESLQRASPESRWFLANLVLHPPAEVVGTSGLNGHVLLPTQDAEVAGVGPLPVPADWPSFPGYELLARMGGGMGEVYKARHLRTCRLVALKTVLPARNPDDPDYTERLKRFQTEAASISRLQHPNIVSIYDVGELSGRPYFTMEWIDAGSLAEYLAGKPLAERQAAEWVALLARAVHHVHQCGIVHRDLKPANILLQGAKGEGRRASVDSTGVSSLPPNPWPLTPSYLTPKITDFGVAKLLGRSGVRTHPGQWLGTPEYMAPEQTTTGEGTHEVGPAADVYALGVLLYEMLTGRPPFKAEEPLETLRQVCDEEPVSPRRLRPRLQRDLETICLKCLHKDPRRRYLSAQALADDLHCWSEGRAIQARPSGAGERAWKWAKRHPERAALTALAGILLLALTAGFFWQWWAGTASYARQLAGSADYQLLLVKYAVGQTAQDGDLHRLLLTPEPDRLACRKYLEKTKDDFVRWFTRPGENPSIINWFVMDPQGTILADSYEDPKSVGKNYGFRDYFAGLMRDAPTAPGAVYLSRVYQSEQDERFKFTAITRIEEAGQVVGLLGASLAIDDRLVALDMIRERPGACIVGPMDRNRKPGQLGGPDELAPYVVVLHRDYASAGQRPSAIADGRLTKLEAFALDPTLEEASDMLTRSGCCVHYARVGDSSFVVVVEESYPWPLSLPLKHPLLFGGLTLTMLAGLGLLRRRYIARRSGF